MAGMKRGAVDLFTRTACCPTMASITSIVAGQAPPMSQESQEHQGLLESLRRGDQEALAALFSVHRERLRKMIEFRLDARLRGRVSTSDVLQEAYIDALKRLPHFQ